MATLLTSLCGCEKACRPVWLQYSQACVAVSSFVCLCGYNIRKPVWLCTILYACVATSSTCLCGCEELVSLCGYLKHKPVWLWNLQACVAAYITSLCGWLSCMPVWLHPSRSTVFLIWAFASMSECRECVYSWDVTDTFHDNNRWYQIRPERMPLWTSVTATTDALTACKIMLRLEI